MLVWGLLLILICWRISGLALDDMYITYRYAHNLATGKGLTFNPGERVFGLSDPGIAMILAGGTALTGLAIPALGTIVTAAALLTIAGAVLWESGRRGRFAEAVAGGTLIITSAYLWLGQGSGPLVALAFLAGAALLAERHPALSGLMSGIAVWCRPDALIGAGLLAWLVYRQKRRLPWEFLSCLLLVCGIGLATAWVYFGRLLPATLAVKQSFAARNPGSLTGFQGFWGRALNVFKWTEGRWGQILIPLGVLGSFHLYRSSDLAGRLLLFYGSALAVVYTLLRLPFFVWYVGPTAAWILVSAGFAVIGAVRLARRAVGKAGAAAAILVAVIGIGFPATSVRVSWLRDRFSGDWKRIAYRAVGEWLARNTPPDADVAFDEVGIVGFYSERPMLDLIGLVTPSSIPYTAVGDQLGAFLVKPTEYVLLHTYDWRGGTRPIVSRPWFPSSYRERVRIYLPRFRVAIVVFERKSDAQIPPPRPPHDKRAALPVR